jgi:flagellar L-ring protein FlgH
VDLRSPLGSTGLLALALLLAGCGVSERLAEVGRAPALSPIENPVERPGYRPVSLPMPAAVVEPERAPNSLWRPGARAFFRDQRARGVGDVLTVEVTISDEASLKNETSRSRRNSEDFGMGGLFGLQNVLTDILPQPVDAGRLVDLDSATGSTGRGNVQRTESIKLNVAAVVMQTLPNGNLVIQGRQEVRVNFEVRELLVVGVVRPEDITPQNTISHDKIAELRVAYGGRGHITDVQQPRYGQQVLDIILPF